MDVGAGYGTEIRRRVCPGIKENRRANQVRNGYSNETARIDYQVLITKCNLAVRGDCKDDKEISRVIAAFYITLYAIYGRAELSNAASYHGSPIIMKDIFHSQF